MRVAFGGCADSSRAWPQNEDSGPAEDYEKSEMLMYKNMVIQESGDLPKALAHLDEIAPDVVDGLALRQTRGKRRVLVPFRVEVGVPAATACTHVSARFCSIAAASAGEVRRIRGRVRGAAGHECRQL